MPAMVFSCGLTASETSAMNPPADTLTKYRSFSRPTSTAAGSRSKSCGDRLLDVLRNAERGREVIARAERNHAEGDRLEAPGEAGDAVEHLVQRAVAAADEQVIDAVLHRPRRRESGVTFAHGHDDLQHARRVRAGGG